MQYFSTSTRLPPYLPYPRFLLGFPLNETARLVYSLILSRIHLSQANGWEDAGRVFCRYTIRELMADTGKCKSTITTALADLEKQGCFYLLKASLIFFSAQKFTEASENRKPPYFMVFRLREQQCWQRCHKEQSQEGTTQHDGGQEPVRKSPERRIRRIHLQHLS